MLRIHHGIRPRPRGKPTYRLVTQMEGDHGYLRRDARKALAQGLLGKFPESWKPAEENAAIEVWLTIQGATAVCGLRLSDHTMRHRTYKLEHRPASLRPTVAAALVRLAGIKPGHLVLDPMCGVGTILAEYLEVRVRCRDGSPAPWVGTANGRPCARRGSTCAASGSAALAVWEATRLPLASASVDRVLSNPPFGKQLSDPEAIGPLYQGMVREYDRVMRPGGRAVLLTSAAALLRGSARQAGWTSLRQVPLRLLGQHAVISVWQKVT